MVKKYWDLDEPVFHILDNGQWVPWTIRHAVQGLHVWGSTGSGKSSGSAKTILKKYLSLGFGGLILTVKPSEKKAIEDYCKQTGRTDDLIIIEPGRANYFNLLEHISTVSDTGSYAANVVEALLTVLQAGEEKDGNGSTDPFWDTSLRLTLMRLVQLSQLAYGKVTAQTFYDIARTLPRRAEQGSALKPDSTKKQTAYDRAFILAGDNVDALIKDFMQTLSPNHGLSAEALDQLLEDKVPEHRIMKKVDSFFFETLHELSSKTRTIIDFNLLGFLSGLLDDPIYTLFSRHASNFTPADAYRKGAIIVVNLPVKEYHGAGRMCQLLMKYIFQRDMEKRDAEVEQRPVFIFADESQHFLHAKDGEFQATARSARVATLYVSQNLSNYYAAMNGGQSEHRVAGFNATLTTHLFHANNDLTTNKWASDLCGDAWFKEESEARCNAEDNISITRTVSAQLKRIVRPEQFSQLITGGPQNDHTVTGYIHVQGKTFSSGFNHQLLSFTQID